jgi:5-methylthioadenosine/S-adenosylhomocysteine deaminase
VRNGITTIQDMNSLAPQDEETLDTILGAYAEIGIRVVFSIAVREPWTLPVSATGRARGRTGRDPWRSERCARGDRVRRAPNQASDALAAPLDPGLESPRAAAFIACFTHVSDLAQRFGLPIFAHVYETKAQTAKARAIYGEHDGSMIRHLADIGLLIPRTTIAHGV